MALRELAERQVDGVVVRLVWNDAAPPGSDISVEYSDERRGEAFILYPPRDSALDAFYHPNAFTGRARVWCDLRAAPR
jgi:hypothetical protein